MISYPDPRQYPVAFATAVLRILSDLKKYREAFPKVPESFSSGVETVQSLPWDFGRAEFSFAALPEVYNYLRGGKRLEIPDSWRAVLPPGFL